MNEFTLPANLFRTLMHPARLSILEILRDGEQCVCHLEAVLGYRQAYISQHLMFLREAGLVDDRRDGTRIYYRVIKPEIFNLLDAAIRMSGMEPEGRKNIQAGHCPCPKCNPSGSKDMVSENRAIAME
jgi:DNA-binding transcriptional ArsR family regulator